MIAHVDLSPQISTDQRQDSPPAIHNTPAFRAIRVLKTALPELREAEAKFLDAAETTRAVINRIDDAIRDLRDSVFEEHRDNG